MTAGTKSGVGRVFGAGGGGEVGCRVSYPCCQTVQKLEREKKKKGMKEEEGKGKK